jgi:anti-anti-sigma factor
MRLTDFFITVHDLEAAKTHIKGDGKYSSVQLRTLPSSPYPALIWSGELTAANAEEVWTSTMDHLTARSLVQRTLTIDLGKLHFVDSTGIGVMIRARKYAARQGMKLQFAQVQPNVLNVIRLSRLEDYLLQAE